MRYFSSFYTKLVLKLLVKCILLLQESYATAIISYIVICILNSYYGVKIIVHYFSKINKMNNQRIDIIDYLMKKCFDVLQEYAIGGPFVNFEGIH